MNKYIPVNELCKWNLCFCTIVFFLSDFNNVKFTNVNAIKISESSRRESEYHIWHSPYNLAYVAILGSKRDAVSSPKREIHQETRTYTRTRIVTYTLQNKSFDSFWWWLLLRTISQKKIQNSKIYYKCHDLLSRRIAIDRERRLFLHGLRNPFQEKSYKNVWSRCTLHFAT